MSLWLWILLESNWFQMCEELHERSWQVFYWISQRHRCQCLHVWTQLLLGRRLEMCEELFNPKRHVCHQDQPIESWGVFVHKQFLLENDGSEMCEELRDEGGWEFGRVEIGQYHWMQLFCWIFLEIWQQMWQELLQTVWYVFCWNELEQHELMSVWFGLLLE